MKKRIISMLLCLLMLLNVIPVSAFALNDNGDELFKDVDQNEWYYDAILEAVDTTLFSGTSNDVFSPDDPMTRAVFITAMGRIAGVEAGELWESDRFVDVQANDEFAPYVRWAVEQGITQGVGDNRFDPDGLITREQMATFTVRFFDAYGIDYPEGTAEKIPVDFETIESYAKDAVMTLWNSGLFIGDEAGYFQPKGNATRAEGATFSVRMNKLFSSQYIGAQTQTEVRKMRSYVTSQSVTYVSNGGSKIEVQHLIRGSVLEKLPIPFKENEIFSGWYYDKNLENKVYNSDTLTHDLILYAKYGEVAPLVELATPKFASALDQGTDFTIALEAMASMSPAQVESLVTIKNINSPNQMDIIQVEGDGTLFIISGKGGFEEGSTYKMSLESENLIFQGFASSVRTFNFTIAKEDVLNLALSPDMNYLPFEQISNLIQEGEAVETLATPLAAVGGDGDEAMSNFTEGSFTYEGSLEVGSTVTIYQGIRPDLRVLDDTRDGADGAIAYVTITEASDNTYAFENAAAEDVLFTPDVLPLNPAEDTDGNPTNHSLTVLEAVMVYSDDQYAPLGLDSQTTVDVGDFIAFYQGPFGANAVMNGYGVIVSISQDEEFLVMEYEEVTLEEILAAMDMYNTEPMSGETLLEEADVAALEADIERQAIESGFADEAALYLSDLALKTDSFTQLSEDFELTGYELFSEDGTPIDPEELQLLGSESRVEVELDKLHANISTHLQHFDASGVRLTLDVGVKITIVAAEDKEIVITVTGTFEEEVHVSINVDGGAVWKWWGMFPTISEYEVTANMDIANFTGIGINASIVTKEKEDNVWTENKELQNISDELRSLLDKKDSMSGDGGTVADGLSDKYKAMLETESDWVNLFEQEIVKQVIPIPPIYVIVVELGVNFAVSADMNISLGCDFYYENAKRYSYTVEIFAQNVTSDVIDLSEEVYEFTFYAMGTMGLRAGIVVEVKVALISSKVASVGFSAESGIYTRVWGYFYYQLKYTASKGRSSGYAGAFFLEVGVYLEIQFEAQVGAGTLAYNPTLYENEWPLWSAGVQKSVQDFGYEETADLFLKKQIRSLTVSDDLFLMSYMDLKTGEEDEEHYDDASCFTIETTNDAFTYDTETNTLSVIPDEGEPIEEGELVIVWAGSALAFTSAPIQRVVKIHWDELNNGYTIAFETNGGSAVPMIVMPYNTPVAAIDEPVKSGYDFDGWYTDNTYQKAYEWPETMPDQDVIVYAKWLPREDTVYRVEHYQQNLNNYLYTLVEGDTQILAGTTDSFAKLVPNTYSGFHSPEAQNLMVLPDGSAVGKIYYSRDSFTATFDPGEAGGEATVSKFKFGKSIVAPQFGARGYEFASWDQEVPANMPANDLVFVAQWSPAADTSYRIEHYIQNTTGDGTTLSEIEERIGNTNQELLLQGFAKNWEGISFEKATVKGKPVASAEIKGDGSLVVKLYCLRNEYQVEYLVENGEDSETIYRYDALVAQPREPAKDGYTFSGWTSNLEGTEAFVFGETMPAQDVTVYGALIPNQGTPFSVEHYRQQTTGDDYDLVGTDQGAGVTDESLDVTSFARVEEGISYEKSWVNGKRVERVALAGDGSLVIQMHYLRNEYVMIHQISNGDDSQKTYRFDERIALPIVPRKAGYVFTGWKVDEALTEAYQTETMPSENQSVYGAYIPNRDTAYRVEHYQENVSGGYTLVNADQLFGVTDTQTAANANDYTGFSGKEWEQAVISGDGSTVIRIDYSRNIYEIELETAGGTINTGNFDAYTYGIGAPLPTDITRAGYAFDGWLEGTEQVAFITESEIGNKAYTASWVADRDTAYTVKHIREDLKGRYTIEEIETRTGTTDTETEASANDYTGFTAGVVVQNGIAGDGSTVVEIRYDRNTYVLNWNLLKGSMRGFYTQGVVKYGAPIIPPVVEEEGYTFSEWYAEPGLETGIDIPETMPAEDLVVFGTIIANSGIAYQIRHLLQNADDDGYTLADTEMLVGYTDEAVIATEEVYDYFIYDAGRSQESGTIDADGSLVLNLYYNRDVFTVDYEVDGESYGEQESYKHGETVRYPNLPEKEGYYFDAWQLAESSFTGNMPTENVLLTAAWSAGEKTYTVRYYQERLTYTDEKDRWALLTEASTVETGTFDSTIEVAPENEYTGFTTPETQEVILNSQLSTVDFQYVRNRYELVWNRNEGATTNDYTESGMICFGTPIVAPILVKTGESYVWDQTPAETMPAKALAYTAAWSPNAYWVDFNEAGLGRMSVIYGETYGTLPIPDKTGYRFDGWYTSNADDGEKIEGETLVAIAEDHRLYAHWTAKSYTLTWEFSGGTAGGDYTLGEVDFATQLIAPIPTRAGYTFAGWNPGVAETMLAEDLIYTAAWTANSYIVGFNEAGIGGLAVTYDNAYGDLPIPSKTGYQFTGWYTSTSNDGEKIESNSLVSIARDHILYAHWEVLAFTLTWDLTGGTAQGEYTQGNVDYGSPIIEPVPSKIGHAFNGWDREPASTMPTENLTYTATWTALTYPVSLNPNGGAIQSGNIETYTYGVGAVLPVDLAKTGYTFEGWYEGEEKIDRILTTDTEGKTYLASWSANSYAITYKYLEEASNHANNTNTYVFEIGLVLGTPTRTGYNFTGWYRDEACSIPITSISTSEIGPVDLYAGWVPKTYQVTLNTNGGTLSEGSGLSSYTYGIVAILPAADKISRTGYTFTGWTDGSGTVTEILSSTIGIQSYMATWVAVNYQISYVLNGGSNSSDNPSKYTIESADIRLGEPGKTGYGFDGWFIDGGFGTPAGSPAIPKGSSGNRTLYAKWKANSYRVVFNANEGEGTMAAQIFTVDAGQALHANAFAREGYDFVGWATSANGGKAYNNEASMINASLVDGGIVNLYALWSPITYAITYELNGGTNAANPVTYTVESQGIVLKDPSRGGGYVFSGWYQNSEFAGSAVTTIQAGTSGNLAFYALWKHYGVFTVSAGSNNTFTITRTGGFDESQRVYYRTQNGSAIGGTHFTHANSSVVFGQGESSKTITIQENAVSTAYAGKVATSYANVDRVYFFDLYKVEGGGALGTQTRMTRTMAKNASMVVDSNKLNNYQKIAASTGSRTIKEASDERQTYYGNIASPVLSNSAYSSTLQTYIRNTASAMKVQLQDFNSRDNGKRMRRYVLFLSGTTSPSFSSDVGTSVPNVPSNTKAALQFGFSSDIDDETSFNVDLPNSAGLIPADGTGRSVRIFDIKWASGQDQGDYVLYGLDETCGISLAAYCGAWLRQEWVFNSSKLYAQPKDVKEPSLLGIAPMANATYNDGDKIVIALVFDEIVASASNVKIRTALSPTAFTLTGGLGTNVLYFEGTVSGYGGTAPTKANTIIDNASNIKDLCN